MRDTFRLTPIGVGAAYGRPGEAQSAYLVQVEDTAVCLDLGAGTFNRLRDRIAPTELSALVVTHLHPDHWVDLFALRVYMEWGGGRGRTLAVYGPEGLPAMVRAIADDGWDWMRFHPLVAGAPVQVGAALMVCAEVPHTEPTFAVRLDHGPSSITYGADCAPNDALIELARGTTVLIAECSDGVDAPTGRRVHLTGSEAGAIAGAAGAGALLLTHCYPEHDRQAVLDAACVAFGGPVAWADQGREVAVSNA